MKTRKHISTVILIMTIIVGLFLMFYPSASNYINSLGHKGIIDDYNNAVENSNYDYSEMLEAARQYNKELAENTPYIAELTSERRQVYESLLDIMGIGVMGYIEIPAANISLPIYHGTSEEVLRSGVGHVEGSSLPVGGESVHTILSGHRGLPSARLFTDVDRLKEGDLFFLHILNETFTYEVDQIQTIDPSIPSDLKIEKGHDYCTLMTCTPYGVNTHRLLVRGHRVPTPENDESDVSDTEVKESDGKWYLKWTVPAAIVMSIAVTTGAWLISRHRRSAGKKEKSSKKSK